MEDLSLSFIGDELVAGYGDARALGWTGRVLARTHREPAIMATTTEATPPTRTDQRAPRFSPIHPTRGEPMGVAPRKIIVYSAMTRPRMCSAVEIWMAAFADVIIVSIARPVGTESTANHV